MSLLAEQGTQRSDIRVVGGAAALHGIDRAPQIGRTCVVRRGADFVLVCDLHGPASLPSDYETAFSSTCPGCAAEVELARCRAWFA